MKQEKILRDLLSHANYYWYDDHDSRPGSIDPDEFDPALDKIFKANAYELEKLYDEIDNSRSQVIKGLANVLVPDKYTLSEPGYTVAHLKPKFSRIKIEPEDMFVISGKDDTGEDHDFFFTTLSQQEYPSCEIKWIINGNSLWEIQAGNPPAETKVVESNTDSKVIWMGLDVGKMEKGDRIPFFVGNQIMDQFDKDFAVFHLGRWSVNGDPYHRLTIKKGLTHLMPSTYNNKSLTDTLDINDSYEKRIIHRFKDSFLTVTGFPSNPNEFLRTSPPGFEHWNDLKEPLLWVKIELDLDLSSDFFARHMVYPNAIPLVNRKLISRNISKSSYDRMLIPMPTSGYFLGVNQIWDDTGNSRSYETVNFLAPDSVPASYLIRKGERVRRLNSKDAKQQILSLLDLIYDEVGTFKEAGENRLTQEFQTIDKALNRIKLRLGQLEGNDWNKSDYFALVNIRSNASIVYYDYWECQGREVRNLNPKINLEVRSNDVQIENSFSLIPIQGGENEKSEEDYLNFLKTALISRNKIVTKGDIEIFCLTKYGHFISNVLVAHKITPMMENPSQKERVIAVGVKLKKPLHENEKQFLISQIQNELNSMSVFFTPIIVQIDAKDFVA